MRGRLMACVVPGLLLLVGCASAPRGQTAPTSPVPSPSATPASGNLSPDERRDLCALLPTAVTTTVAYYAHTENVASPPTSETVDEEGTAILRPHTDTEIESDDVALAFLGWRGSLIRGERASAAALATWKIVCQKA